MKKPAGVILLLLILSVCSGCGRSTSDDSYYSEFFAMDTVMFITAYGNNAETAAKSLRARDLPA